VCWTRTAACTHNATAASKTAPVDGASSVQQRHLLHSRLRPASIRFPCVVCVTQDDEFGVRVSHILVHRLWLCCPHKKGSFGHRPTCGSSLLRSWLATVLATTWCWMVASSWINQSVLCRQRCVALGSSCFPRPQTFRSLSLQNRVCSLAFIPIQLLPS